MKSIDKVLLAMFLATFVLSSCLYVSNEPTIEGTRDKYFDSKAQRKYFQVVTASGRPYNHKVDWHIDGIMKENTDVFLTQQVDTLSNGDLKIAYDWVSFVVKQRKSVIEVEVLQNKTGKRRVVYFATRNSRYGAYLPNMIIIQEAE